MESSDVHEHQPNDEDRLSALTDDILLSILGRFDITTAAKTSVLSKRWRNLPWLLPHPDLCIWDFLPVPRPKPVEPHHMDRATASLTKATRRFLAYPGAGAGAVTRLSVSLQLYVSRDYSREIGPLVSDAIDRGTVKELGLEIVVAKDPTDYKQEDMVQHARDVDGFFSAYPCVFRCLTELILNSVQFAGDGEIHHLLFDCCKQLQHLGMFHCGVGGRSVWQINAPDSKLRVLEIYIFCSERVEVLCLPKLEEFHWSDWSCFDAPLRFGFVPSLKELTLECAATVDFREFSLSEVLRGAPNIRTLTLDFQEERLWMLPEGKQLCPAFSKLKQLCIHGIFVEFDLLWTIYLLEAAPSVELFSVQVSEHPCLQDGVLRTTRTFGAERTKPSWSMPGFTSSKTWQLKELEFIGFRPLEQQIIFVRAVMERAPNLKTVLLKEDEEPCEYCDAMDTPPPPRGGFFPRDRDEQETVVQQLNREWRSSSAQIIFSNNHTS